MKQYQKILIIVLILLSLSFFLLSLKLSFQNWQLHQQVSNLTSQTSLILTPTPSIWTTPNQEQEADMANWKKYTNTKFGFEIMYPGSWEVAENIPTDIKDLDISNRLYLLFNRAPIPERYKKETLTHPWPELSIYIGKLHNQDSLKSFFTTEGIIYYGVVYNKTQHASYTFKSVPGKKIYPESKTMPEDNQLGQIIFNYNNYGWEITFPVSDFKGSVIPIFDQTLSTFRFMDENSQSDNLLEIWDPICEAKSLDKFDIKVKPGDGPTNLSRRGLEGYLIALSLAYMPKNVSLSSAEKVYAEDYIRKNQSFSNYSVGSTIQIQCKLIEEASLKARLLTISQKQNLEEYSKNVSKYEILDLINQVIEETMPEKGIKPQIFSP